MNLTKPQIIFLGAVGFIILVFVLVFLRVIPGLQRETDPRKIQAEIKFWGIPDSAALWNNALAKIKEIYPKVTVNYRGFSDEKEYEETLLNALAENAGPDIFMLKNNALPKEINKIFPVPQTKLTPFELKNLYPRIVEQDFVSQNLVYALPLSIDTLVLLYNRNILDEAAVSPPETWEDLEAAIPKLVKIEKDNIKRAAVALGGARNVRHAADILSLLMLQTGTAMTAPGFRSASFASNEGLEALGFYTRFADAESATYTWNETMPDSLEAFANGTVAMIFGYLSDLKEIKSRNAFLDFGIAPMLQPREAKEAARSITYPSYWGLTVSRGSWKANLAWDIILKLANDPSIAKSYLDAGKKPPALRALVNSYLNNPDLSVSAKQILIARSWPQADPEKIENIFTDLIEAVTIRGTSARGALEEAEKRVTALMAKRTF